MSRVTSRIGVVLMNVQIGLVVAQTVDDVERLAVVGADDLGMEGEPKVGGVAVDRRTTARTEVGRIVIGLGSVDCDSDAHAIG